MERHHTMQAQEDAYRIFTSNKKEYERRVLEQKTRYPPNVE